MPYSNYGWLYCGIVVYHVSGVVLPARWGLGVAGRKNRAELWYYHLPQPPSFINITRISPSSICIVCSEHFIFCTVKVENPSKALFGSFGTVKIIRMVMLDCLFCTIVVAFCFSLRFVFGFVCVCHNNALRASSTT